MNWGVVGTHSCLAFAWIHLCIIIILPLDSTFPEDQSAAYTSLFFHNSQYHQTPGDMVILNKYLWVDLHWILTNTELKLAIILYHWILTGLIKMNENSSNADYGEVSVIHADLRGITSLFLCSIYDLNDIKVF